MTVKKIFESTGYILFIVQRSDSFSLIFNAKLNDLRRATE